MLLADDFATQNSNLVAGFYMFLVWINLVAIGSWFLFYAFKIFQNVRWSPRFFNFRFPLHAAVEDNDVGVSRVATPATVLFFECETSVVAIYIHSKYVNMYEYVQSGTLTSLKKL